MFELHGRNDDYLTVKPVEIDSIIHNPDMGWGIWAGAIHYDGTRFNLEENTTAFGDDISLLDWVLVDWMWAELEPEEGKYRFSELDAIINYWAKRGKQIALRVWVTDDPGWAGDPGSLTCPEWLWERGVRYREYVGEGGVVQKEPDYCDPSYDAIYFPKLARLLKALAQHYDRPGNPFCLMGCMGYGQWGEWHTMWSGYPWPSKEKKIAVLRKIVNLYANTFKHIPLSISYANDNDVKLIHQIREDSGNFGIPYLIPGSELIETLEDFKTCHALDLAIKRNFILARHGFINGLGDVDRELMRESWKKVPMWAEANWGYDMEEDYKRGVYGTLDENLDIMLQWHSNFVHFYMESKSYLRALQEDRPCMERALKPGGLGYRFVLTEAKYHQERQPGALLLMKQNWVNRNAGKCYHRYYLRVWLIDQNGKEVWSEVDYTFDPRPWVQGEDYRRTSVLHLSRDIPEGIYELRIAIVDESKEPKIRLGIAGRDSEGRYNIGTLKVKE